MPRSADFQDVEYKNFSGLDLRGPTENIPDKSLQSLINFEVTDLGTLKSRPGFQQKYNGSAFGTNPVKFIGQFSSNTRNHILIQVVIDGYTGYPYHGTGGLVYRSADGGNTWFSTSPGVVTCGRAAQWGSAAMSIPTTAGIATWDGSTWGAGATKNSSYNAWYHQDRLWLIENSTGNIIFSDPGNAGSWPAANTIGFTTDNKDNIVGLQPYRDRMLVFFQNSIRVIYTNGPPSSWQMKFLPFSNLGVRNQDCYTVQSDLLYFLSSEAFYRTDLTQLEELSKPIAPLLQRRWESYDLNAATWPKYKDAIGYWRGRFIITARIYTKLAGPVPTLKMFMYNIRNGAWSEIVPNVSSSDGIPYSVANSFLPVFIGKRQVNGADYNKPGLYTTFGDPSGRIYLFDDEDPAYYDGTSTATAFTRSFKTKEIDLDSPSEYKRSHTVTFRSKRTSTTNPFTVKYNVNGVDRSPISVPNTSALDTQTRIKGPGYFRRFNLEFTETDDWNVPLEIEGITVNVKKKGPLPEAQT